MPVAEFAGTRGWGYDGVLWFAPESSYGTSDDLKAFVDAAHELGLCSCGGACRPMVGRAGARAAERVR